MAGTDRLRYMTTLTCLILCMLALVGRLVYFFLADPGYFPVNTVKITASCQHVTRQQLEIILARHLREGFWGFSAYDLQRDLMALQWSQDAHVQRIWPDIVKITIVEKKPVAVWNGDLMTANGQVFHPEHTADEREGLPVLSGPVAQQKDVLQIYEKFSKLLGTYGLSANTLQLRENQAWELSLTNGVLIRLGKRDLESRLLRFCRAYPAVFADKSEQLSSVDLRYARGMAVQWKQPTGR